MKKKLLGLVRGLLNAMAGQVLHFWSVFLNYNNIQICGIINYLRVGNLNLKIIVTNLYFAESLNDS